MALFYDGRSEKTLRYNDQVIYFIMIIVHEEKTRVIQRCYTLNHCMIASSCYGRLESGAVGFLAFQFVLSLTVLAYKIFYRSICLCSFYGNFSTDGTKHVVCQPIFR